jgi:hypothetical protein
MPPKYSFFDNLDHYEEDKQARAQDRIAEPSSFTHRDSEIKEAKKHFLSKLKSLPLNAPLAIDPLVMNTFGLRMEEGLKDLLDTYANWQKSGHDIVIVGLKDVAQEPAPKPAESSPENQPLFSQPEAVITKKERRGKADFLRGFSSRDRSIYEFMLFNNQPGVSTNLDKLRFPDHFGWVRKNKFIGLLCNAGLMRDDGDYHYTLLQPETKD